MTPRLSRRTATALVALAVALAPLPPGIAAHAQSEAPGEAPNLVRDTEIEEILHHDADPILRAAGLNPAVVQLHLIGDHALNAFVAGGQHMFINTGLIEKADTPNQLIGVMAHETGHMAGGHLARSGDMEKAGAGVFMLTLGLGVLAAIAGAPDAAAALLGSSPYFGELSVLGYSRQQEARADQAAVTYLTKAHESARGLVDFFDNFRYEEVFSQAKRFPFFQSHPVTSERIELLRQRAEGEPYYNAADTPQAIFEHAVMRAKLDGFENPPQQTFVDYKETDASFPARYARAIAYYRAGETDRAVGFIDKLIADYPGNPYLYELKGQTLFDAGRTADAEAPQRTAVALKPTAPLLQVSLAQTLVAENDKPKLIQALTLLRDSVRRDQDNAFAWRLMAQAYDGLGQDGQARLATAEERFSLGDLKQARVFALRARAMLPPGAPDWRRATDIVLTSNPSGSELKPGGGEG